MVTLKKKTIGTKTYYYLRHTLRTKKGIQTREKYLGRKLPPSLEKAESAFMTEIYKEQWYPALDQIKQNYSKELEKTPKSALEKKTLTFSVKFTYDTNRIEGSKLTYRETADLLERGLTPRSKPVQDVKEAQAHEKLFLKIVEYKKDLTQNTVLDWHRQLLESTKPDLAGLIRQHQVAISGSRFLPPSPIEVPILVDEFFKWYLKSKDKTHPVELAALVHLKWVTIHPFGDGNGRISRLLMNFVLNKHGCPMLNIPYQNRNSYYHALERSQTKNTHASFVQWFFKKYVKENKKST